MKGPLSRGKFDFRRLWQCPSCGWRCYSSGAEVNMLCTPCGKQGQRVFMHLQAEKPRPFLGPSPLQPPQEKA